MPARRLAAGDEDAAPGRLDAAERAAQVQRLAGDDTGRRRPGVHRIGVHHPGHDLAVGVDVGCRDVALRADDDADLAGVAPRHPLELLQRQQLRIAADAALRAAVRQVHRGALDRHPRRQRHHLLERHVGVVAHAPLAGAARQVVLDPVALEVGDAAVVHLDRHVDDQRALRALQRLRPAGERPEVRQHAIDLREVGVPRAGGSRVEVGKETHRRSPQHWIGVRPNGSETVGAKQAAAGPPSCRLCIMETSPSHGRAKRAGDQPNWSPSSWARWRAASRARTKASRDARRLERHQRGVRSCRPSM